MRGGTEEDAGFDAALVGGRGSARLSMNAALVGTWIGSAKSNSVLPGGCLTRGGDSVMDRHSAHDVAIASFRQLQRPASH